METTTAIANSRTRLKLARICLAFGENLSAQIAIRRMRLKMKVKPAAMMMNAAVWLKSRFL